MHDGVMITVSGGSHKRWAADMGPPGASLPLAPPDAPPFVGDGPGDDPAGEALPLAPPEAPPFVGDGPRGDPAGKERTTGELAVGGAPGLDSARTRARRVQRKVRKSTDNELHKRHGPARRVRVP